MNEMNTVRTVRAATNFNDVAVACFGAVGKIGVAYIIGACLCGWNAIIPWDRIIEARNRRKGS